MRPSREELPWTFDKVRTIQTDTVATTYGGVPPNWNGLYYAGEESDFVREYPTRPGFGGVVTCFQNARNFWVNLDHNVELHDEILELLRKEKKTPLPVTEVNKNSCVAYIVIKFFQNLGWIFHEKKRERVFLMDSDPSKLFLLDKGHFYRGFRPVYKITASRALSAPSLSFPVCLGSEYYVLFMFSVHDCNLAISKPLPEEERTKFEDFIRLGGRRLLIHPAWKGETGDVKETGRGHIRYSVKLKIADDDLWMGDDNDF